jgi:NADH-quinone oxidoreductase subunit L
MGSGFIGAVENAITPDVHHFSLDWGIAIVSTILVLVGLAAAYRVWAQEPEIAVATANRFPFFYRLFRNKFYIDDFYQWAINNIFLVLARLIAFFDRAVVNDTGVNGAGETTGAFGFILKFTETGRLPNYALAMIVGVVVIAIIGFSVKG